MKNIKIYKSKYYNYIFNLENGYFARWGEFVKDDPKFSPVGPEIADIEIGTICHGLGTPCSFCYKANSPKGEYMSFEKFKKVFNKFPKTLTQIAFGLGDIDSNPDLWKICEYCLKNEVVPNITINGARLNNEIVQNLVKYMGAVAVSHYDDDICFNAIKKLIDNGAKQINIHKLLAKETLESCYDLIKKVKSDSRLKKLNAVVFLSLKNKGSRNNFKIISQKEFNELVKSIIDSKINYGFDSCGSTKFLKSIKDSQNESKLTTFIEPCESSLFSIYVNVKGEAFPCSFCENEKKWKKGIDLIHINDFMKQLWKNKRICSFRTDLLDNNRKCPVFKI
jgi:MoaA/NifB/PqqE/SkfB family radical SAM enzyme